MGRLNGSTLAQADLRGVRVSRPTATLPQTAAGAIFTISGGRIQVTQILGEVTTTIQTQANNTKLVANPTVGNSIDLCAVIDITAQIASSLLGITGTFADVMNGANVGALQGVQIPFVIAVGTIDLDCAASNTGSVKWELWYIPLDPGATVVAA